MRNMKWTSACLLALSLTGCPGEITDPEDFLGSEGSVVGTDAGQGAGTGGGGNTPADAGGSSTPRDAGGGGVDAGRATTDAGTGGGEADAATPVLPSCDFKALMVAKCGTAACHGAPGLSTGLDLVSDGAAARMEGKNATGGCGSYKLIDKANPAQSALYLLVTNKPCGVRMPIGGSMSEAEQQCVLTWIQSL